MMCFNLPQRMINIAKLACVIGVVSVVFSSCLQKDVYDPANSGDKEEVTLDNYFDFATTKNIQLNIDYGKECPRAYFEVYAENPLSYVAEGGQIIKKAGVSHIATGFTDIQGRYIKPASIPTAVSEVYIYSPDFGVPTLYKTKVVGSDVSAKITFENALDVTALDSSTRSAQTRSSLKFITNVIPNVLGTWNVNTGRPNYLDASKKINVDATLKSYITTYFPEGKNNVGTNLVSDDADILIKEDANVVVNYFGGDTGAQSVFAYYCYSENASIDKIRQAAKHACVIFPNVHKSSLGNYSGVAVNLKYIDETGSFPEEEPERIPAGTKIGFLIWNDGWREVMEEKIRLAVFGQKRLSREGGIEIVVIELCTRMAQNGCDVTCYNRAGHHVSGAEYDKTIEYDGIRQKVVPTIEKKGARDIIRRCHNRDKGTAENERLRNPKFIFSYPKNERLIFLGGSNAIQKEISTMRVG